RLVVFGEWPLGERPERAEETSDAFGVHDERAHVILGVGIGLEVRHVVADPSLLRFAPPDLFALRVPGLARRVARRAVVHDAAVSGPRPRPVRVDAEARRVFSPAPRHLVARLSPRAAVEPVA